jgi:hypothetical protein
MPLTPAVQIDKPNGHNDKMLCSFFMNSKVIIVLFSSKRALAVTFLKGVGDLALCWKLRNEAGQGFFALIHSSVKSKLCAFKKWIASFRSPAKYY